MEGFVAGITLTAFLALCWVAYPMAKPPCAKKVILIRKCQDDDWLCLVEWANAIKKDKRR